MPVHTKASFWPAMCGAERHHPGIGGASKRAAGVRGRPNCARPDEQGMSTNACHMGAPNAIKAPMVRRITTGRGRTDNRGTGWPKV